MKGEPLVPTGYKHTEVGVIPEDWDVMPLECLCKSISDGTHFTPRYVANGVPFYSVENVTSNDFVNTKFISESEHRSLIRRCKPQRGDILMTRITAGILGDTKLIDWDVNASIYVSLALLKLNERIRSDYLYRYSRSSSFLRDVEKRGLKNATPKKINMDAIGAIPIPAPRLAKEQKAIAEALGDADTLIESMEQLADKKRHLKQAAMQKLLTGKKRLPGFEGEWESKPIGQLFDFKNGLNKAKEFFGYGTPIVNYMDVFGSSALRAADIKGKVSLSPDEIRNFDVRRGDVFFTRTSETQEEIGTASVMLDDPVHTVFSGFVLRARPTTNELDDQYKRYCFTTDVVRRATVATASYTTRALTNGRLLSAVEILVPDKDEQRAIARVSTDMELEIESIEAKLAKARQIKRGMMKELLTGRTRLV